MKTIIFKLLAVFVIFLFVVYACKKDEKTTPTITTVSVTEIAATSARSGGNITSDGDAQVTTRGLVFSTSQMPTLEQNTGFTSEGNGTGLFASLMTTLSPDTEYYVRAYTSNSAGTAYGNQIAFNTLSAGSAPVANFKANPTFGTAPLEVNFTDQSTNNPTSWKWEFGDGNTSTLQNPQHIYQNAGIYTVIFTATNSYGSDTETKSDYISATIAGVTGQPCPGTPTVTDIEGDVYNTVFIGGQCWMKENLKTTKYRHNTPIEYPANNSAWRNNTTGAYAWYNNDISWKDSYGALYNWPAVKLNNNGLCPTGWHVPSDTEWKQLVDYVQAQGFPNSDVTNGAGNALKSCRQVNSPMSGECNTTDHPRWDQHSTHHGFDEFGFSGLPGGLRGETGDFDYIGSGGIWWSSTEFLTHYVLGRFQEYDRGIMYSIPRGKAIGYSVRCLRDSSPAANYTSNSTFGPAPLQVNFTDLSTNNPTSWQWEFGDGNTSTLQNPQHIYQNAGNYTVQFTVTNSYGSDTEIKSNYISVTTGGSTVQPCPGTPTVTDFDGNVYNTVLIYDQCWMKENLKTTNYRNGMPIENPTGNSDWNNNATGAYTWYDNNISWKDSYGALYNWRAVNNTNGLCPTGWHVPSDTEWTQLVDYVLAQGFPNSNVISGAGNALKSCRQVNSPMSGNCNTTEHPRWNQHGTHHGFDEFGFSGLPGGFRRGSGSFDVIGIYGFWWSSTEISSTYAWYRSMYNDYGSVIRYSDNKTGGFSVRCLRD